MYVCMYELKVFDEAEKKYEQVFAHEQAYLEYIFIYPIFTS